MKDTKEFVIPGESVFLDMEEFHKTEGNITWSMFFTVRNGLAFITWNPAYIKGLKSTCTLN